MKIEGIDHIHIVVKDLEGAMKFFSDIMGTQFVGPFDLGHLRTAFDNVGLELVSPQSPDALPAKRMEKMEEGEGLLSIALKVPNLDQAIAELEAKGVRCAAKKERPGIKAAQFNPADAHGVWIELVEYDTVRPVALANLVAVSSQGRIGEVPFFKG